MQLLEKTVSVLTAWRASRTLLCTRCGTYLRIYNSHCALGARIEVANRALLSPTVVANHCLRNVTGQCGHSKRKQTEQNAYMPGFWEDYQLTASPGTVICT